MANTSKTKSPAKTPETDAPEAGVPETKAGIPEMGVPEAEAGTPETPKITVAGLAEAVKQASANKPSLETAYAPKDAQCDFDLPTTRQLSGVPVVKVERLPHWFVPTELSALAYKTKGASAFDLHAAIDRDVCLATLGDRAIIPTGWNVEIPEGYEIQVRPRSGLAANYGISIVNTPGTIDEDYRGEIKIILVNLSTNKFWVRRNDRIAQAVLAPVTRCEFEYVDELTETERGQGGFGSTGVKG